MRTRFAKGTKRNERGVVLIAFYLVLAVLGAFSLALYSRHFTALYAHHRAQNSIKAFHLAESGVDRALDQMRKNLAAFLLCNPQVSPTCWQQGYIAFGDGGYEALVTWVSPLIRRIDATGYIPNNNPTSPGYTERNLETYVRLTLQSAILQGIVGCSEIELSGNALVDSYNSSIAPYDPESPGLNGDIVSNTIQEENISLTGNSSVQGDIAVGPGGNPQSVIQMTGNAVHIGAKVAAPAATPCNAVQVPGSIPDASSLHLSGNQTQTLAPGTYVYESLEITGNAQLQLAGPTTIYVFGEVEISGNGIATSGNLPKNATIKVIGDSDVEVTGNSSFYGVLYAPLSEIEVSGNAQIFGAAFGNSYEQSGNAKFHYDEDLANINLIDIPSLAVINWQEQ